MSATSRAMAAPSLMAMPASASERAGESFTPSPSMMTLRPASCSRRMKFALSSGRTPGVVRRRRRRPAATARAVFSLSPVIMTSVIHAQLVQRRGSRRAPPDGGDPRCRSPRPARRKRRGRGGNTARAGTSNFSSSPAGTDAVLILEDEVVTADDDLLPVDTAGDAVGDDILHAGSAAPRGAARAARPRLQRPWPWSADSAPQGTRPDAACRPRCCRRR